MKAFITLLCLASFGLSAQPKKVTESVTVTGQERLDLEFAFADEIVFKTWEKNEVLVEVMVEINNGEDNDIFTLSSNKSNSTIYIEMDEDMWKKLSKQENGKWNNCSYQSNIYYTVYLPANLNVRSNTISGDYAFEFYGAEMELKTISGAIDVTVPEKKGMDFKAKTISGEIYSDIEIKYPYGRDGLKQIVGQDIRGRVSDGGAESTFETISGDIFLRKG
ncbi:hypothetical protein [Ekhidna sp.]|uniref:hypothetical protein n=1 Tax=Ekhidna sp. TaxID=2608089 RepID=UPI00329A6972